ncbi:MAG: hypothetical protein ACREEY_10400 [Brevundimonas sp.]
MSDPHVEALRRTIIHCPAGDALRYPAQRSWLARLAAGERLAPGPVRLRLPPGPWAVVVIGPGARLTPIGLDHVSALGATVVNFSGLGDIGSDPRRRSLDEGWFAVAKASADAALAAMADGLPDDLGGAVRRHAGALALRLKTDMALRLRRLDLVTTAMQGRPGPVLLIEGDQPLDEVEIAVRTGGEAVARVFAPTSRSAWRRQAERGLGQGARGDADDRPLRAAMRRWAPSLGDMGGRVIVASDLRNKADFRHSGAASALLAEAASVPGGGGAVLMQPRTRMTRNVARATRTALRQGARIRLVRQPQFKGLFPHGAGLRAALLERVHSALPASLGAGRRAAVLEAAGGFIISSLGPSLALALAMEQAVRRAPPAGVVSVPVGSPFGALLVSGARAGGARTMEVQTLMIGKSDRDPPPVAERLAVLDTEQRAIFARRFGIAEDCVVLSGRTAPGGAPTLDEIDANQSGILFASQPLDDICVAAVRLLAPACRGQGVRLNIAPHPDETDQDLDAYRRVLAENPGLEGEVLERGSASRAMQTHRVLATVVSNMAMWAAAQGRDVLTIDVGVPLPLDFASMGIALKAGSIEAIEAVLDDIRRYGPQSEGLRRSRDAFFARNPQLCREDGAATIIRALLT